MKSRKWTNKDLGILRREFPKRPTPEVAKMLGRSAMAVATKASKEGLKKQEGFLDKRRKDISRLAGEELRKIPDRKSSRFKKGVRFNPDGEFKKGHKESPETKAKRIASLKESWRRRKAAKVRYY